MSKEYHLDYETRSEYDIKYGAYRYAMDPSTEVLMASIALNDGPVYLWINPKYETPDCLSDPEAEEMLQDAFSSPDSLIFAHNAQFENAITGFALRRSWSDFVERPDYRKWRCTAAMARRAGLPSALAKASAELDIDEKKDRAGKALIKFFCVPQKDGSFNKPIDHQDKWRIFCDYCIQDTKTERAVHQKLLPFKLVGSSLRAFQLDIRINELGVPVNRKALVHADKLIKQILGKAVRRFIKLTGYTPTQNAKCLTWFKEHGYPYNNMQADTIREFVEAGKTLDDKNAQEALVLKSELGFASIKKVSAMLSCACPDDRVRGTLLFCGASNTGRWSAKLIQPHNFKRPGFKQTNLAFQLIEAGCSEEEIYMVFGNVLEVIASCIRHFIQPKCKAGVFLDADYAAVEARIVCWLAGDQAALDEFICYDNGVGDEPYCLMATKIFKYTVKKGVHEFERFVGKQSVLGCGFGMGWKKFMGTCESYGQPIEARIAKEAVKAFREARKPVKDLWHECDRAAQNAIRNPGKTYYAGKYLRFTMLTVSGIPMLLMKLPSGRNLTYMRPVLKPCVVVMDEVDPKTGKKKRFNTTKIEFYGPIPGRDQVYGIIDTYGGKLVENATQATAYDLMAHGGCEADAAGYLISMLVHDQALEEKQDGQTVEEFCQLLSSLPKWASGLPLVAEGSEIPYYTKT